MSSYNYEPLLNKLIDAVLGWHCLLDEKNYDELLKYVDELIATKLIIKHNSFNFTGEGFANLLTDRISKINPNIVIKGISINDSRITVRCKGQAVYLILQEKEVDKLIIIFAWSMTPIFRTKFKNTKETKKLITYTDEEIELFPETWYPAKYGYLMDLQISENNNKRCDLCLTEKPYVYYHHNNFDVCGKCYNDNN